MQKKVGWRFFLQLFIATFTLSAFTFGGGYVIVPLMRKRFVEEYGWIEEQEMLDLVALSQSSPGPIAVNASILVGYRLAGVPGAFVTILGTVTPPIIIISVISYFYTIFKESPSVAAVLRGMSAGVAAVVVDAIVKMGLNIVNEKSIFSLLMMVGSFVAVFFFGLDVKILLLVAAVLGITFAVINRRKKKEEVSE